MLTAIRLERYRCFEDVHVPLGPLTVFVGPNACGKTSLLRAACGGSWSESDVFRRVGAGGRITRYWGAREESVELRAGNGSVRFGPHLQLDVKRARAENYVSEARELAPDGSNLANAFATIPRRERDVLARQLTQLVPVLADVDVRPQDQGRHRLVFQDRWSESLWFEPSEVSDGTILALALLVAIRQVDRPTLLAVEDLEHALHPVLVGEFVEILRALATDGAAPVQVLLATHSSELLDHLRPDEVRFLSRNETGAVTVETPELDSDGWRDAYEAHQRSLSSLWLSGSAGGVP